MLKNVTDFNECQSISGYLLTIDSILYRYIVYNGDINNIKLYIMEIIYLFKQNIIIFYYRFKFFYLFF